MSAVPAEWDEETGVGEKTLRLRILQQNAGPARD